MVSRSPEPRLSLTAATDKITTVTDDAGRFEMGGLPSTPCRFSVAMFGFEAPPREATASASPLTFDLTPAGSRYDSTRSERTKCTKYACAGTGCGTAGIPSPTEFHRRCERSFSAENTASGAGTQLPIRNTPQQRERKRTRARWLRRSGPRRLPSRRLRRTMHRPQINRRCQPGFPESESSSERR